MAEPTIGILTRLKHLRIDRFRSQQAYRPPGRVIEEKDRWRDRSTHGPKLQTDLTAAFAAAHAALAGRTPDQVDGKAGVYLEVEAAKGALLPDLDWPSKDIRLGAAREMDGVQSGTLFVPESAEAFLAEKVRQYAFENTPSQKPSHFARFDPLEAIRAATVESLWTDQRPIPTDPTAAIWWECWCWRDRAMHLVPAANRLNLRASERRLRFPEFDVIPVYGTRADIVLLLRHTDAIEELRLASDTPVFFTTNVREEQSWWIDDLVARVQPPPPDSPAVCVLDTGMASAHPLLSVALDPNDCLAVDKDWGVDDHDGHGTNMGGTALYGDLLYPLSDLGDLPLETRLESVKLTAPGGFPPTDPENYGAITQAAVALPEIQNPHRSRAYCLAITNEDISGERPTSWSGALDQICAGTMPGDPEDTPPRRLFVVSAGNIGDPSAFDGAEDPGEFPIEDPAQSWNAVTVGGFTDKVEITDEMWKGWTALAKVGDLSPYSRISTDWNHSRAPIKPEVVFEAGNRALSPSERELLAGIDSLSLLTTGRDVIGEPVQTFWATSAAAGQAAGMAASIMARHPDLWPETVRALMVHSAEWTPAMKARLDACIGKKERVALARHFGYGVPQLERALSSAKNDVALIAQAYIQPFKKEERAAPVYNDVHYYQLPWPKQTLEVLGEKDVQLKVTLSYFIDPSPGELAPVLPARYQSFGLRFALKPPTITGQVFRQKINQLERDGSPLPKTDSDTRWMFGSKSIAAGSLHCDVWTGPAAVLAARDMIAIYPVTGWWKERPGAGKANAKARYSLIISIASEEQSAELYAEIANLIGVGIETEVNI